MKIHLKEIDQNPESKALMYEKDVFYEGTYQIDCLNCVWGGKSL